MLGASCCCTSRRVERGTCFDQECKSLVKHNGCSYYHKAKALAVRGGHIASYCTTCNTSDVSVVAPHRIRVLLRQKSMPQLWDIEDLVKSGRITNGCSYFASRELFAAARIVFCPYNYLVDPVVRRAMDINIKSSVRAAYAASSWAAGCSGDRLLNMCIWLC